MRIAMLVSLLDLGGKATKKKVLDNVQANGYIYIDKFMGKYQPTLDEEKWRNRMAWERYKMIELGYMTMPRHGLWELTESGKKYFLELANKANPDIWEYLDSKGFQRTHYHREILESEL